MSAPRKKGKKGVENPTKLSHKYISSKGTLDVLSTLSNRGTRDDKRPSTSNAGSSGHEGRSEAFNEATDLAEQFFGITKEVSEATDLLSPLKSASALMIRVLQAARGTRQNRTEWTDLCEELTPHVAQMEEYRDILEARENLMDTACIEALKNYLSVAEEIVKEAAKSAHSSKSSIIHNIKRLGTFQREKDNISRQRERITAAWQVYHLAMSDSISQKVGQIEEHLETRIKEQISVEPRRRDSDPREFGATLETVASNKIVDDVNLELRIQYGERLDVCEEGTRVEILGRIREWAADKDTKQRIFWLNDAAGTGKSTIAATMAKEWKTEHTLAGRFFFSPDSIMTQGTKTFCHAIAEDIAGNQPDAQEIAQQAINDFPSDHYLHFETRFLRLVAKPLRAVKATGAVMLVIDALDNCIDRRQREELLRTLLGFLPTVKRLKVLLTSRPLQDIALVFHNSHLIYGADIQLLDIHRVDHPDVATYVERKLGRISQISDEQRRAIVTQSSGLFLYAATICRMLEKTRRLPEVIQALLSVQTPQRMGDKMDKLYLSVLKQAQVDHAAEQALMDVLSAIIVAFQPISINTISAFHPSNRHVDDFVQDLAGVLKDGDPDRPIKVLHPTFHEFILSNRDRANGFLVDPRSSHMAIASACLHILSYALEDNILCLKRPGQLRPINKDVPDIDRCLKERTTAVVRYASSFWADHVVASDNPESLWADICEFLAAKFLNWVELMSWMGDISTCISTFSHLQMKAKGHQSLMNDHNLLSIKHAHQFLVHHQLLITESAYQTYSMALALTPKPSPLFNHYYKQYQFEQPQIKTSSFIHWGNHTVLEGHKGQVEHLLFSPDATRLISIGADKRLLLWNAEIGALIAKLSGVEEDDCFLGDEPIEDCTFSADGQYFAFGVMFGQIHVHFSEDGTPAFHHLDHWHLQDGLGQVRLAFHPSGLQLATSVGPSIQLIGLQSGQELCRSCIPEKGFWIGNISFSPDGQTLVIVGSHDKPRQGGKIFLLKSSTLEVVSSHDIISATSSPHHFYLAFSADGAQLATWSKHGPLQLQKGSTGEHITNLMERRLHSQRTMTFGSNSIIFPSQGPYFVCHSISHPLIAIFKKETGEEYFLIEGLCDSPASLISLSSSGQQLSHVSRDQTVHTWDIPSRKLGETIFSGYTGDIYNCLFSKDWQRFVTTTYSHQLKLYNLLESNVGESRRGRTKDQKGGHKKIATPHTGSQIVRWGSGAKVELWDGDTGNMRGQITLPKSDSESDNYITAVAISPDGQLIALATPFAYVHIYFTNSQRLAGKLEHLLNFTSSSGPKRLFFSLDSHLLAGCVPDGVCVWDISSLKQIWKYSQHKYPIYSGEDALAFTPSNNRILHANIYATYLSSLRSSNQIKGPAGKWGYVECCTFSPSEDYFAIGNTGRVEVWKVGNELQCVAEIPLNAAFYKQITFSSDGHYLAFGPYCWDISSLPPQPYVGSSPPPSFPEKGPATHSFLRYSSGWIHSAFPPGPLLPVPKDLQVVASLPPWYAFGETVIVWDEYGDPVIIDCSPVLAQARGSD
ncbi:hypothetical protein FRC17_001565 [Serendipita sp. 399]|nr:hypothetical protein FRC17_001565 [Serendipita sp. 399]